MIHLEINEKTKQGKRLIEFLKTQSYVKFFETEYFLKKIEKSMKDVKKGRTTKINPKNVWKSV